MGMIHSDRKGWAQGGCRIDGLKKKRNSISKGTSKRQSWYYTSFWRGLLLTHEDIHDVLLTYEDIHDVNILLIAVKQTSTLRELISKKRCIPCN